MRDISSTVDARRYTRSSSFKMALFFAAQLGLAVIILGYFGYYFARGYLMQGAEETLATEARYLLAMPAADLRQNISAPADRRFYMLRDGDGKKIAGNIGAVPVNVADIGNGNFLFSPADGRRFAARIYALDNGQSLMIAIDVTKTVRDFNFMLGLSVLSIVLMLTVIGTSFVISVFVVSRTNRIALTARDIMDNGNLSARIVVDSKWDDLGYVSGVLNAFLARIENLVEGVRRVSDNIAHDLRTPLTRLKNSLESLKDTTEERAALEKVDELMKDCDRLLATFNALLRIARIENMRDKTYFRAVDLAPLLHDVVDLYEPVAAERGVTISVRSDSAQVFGDRDLLFQLFVNLVDNAVKFSPAQSIITVTVGTAEPGGAVCTVADQGPGVPLAERDKIFTRFYRGDHSRNTPGNGLGLSLVAAVAGLHDAEIIVSDASPGLSVAVSFKPVKNI